MKKYILILSTLLIAASAMGQEISKETTGLEKGLYVKFELGTSCNFERAFDRKYDSGAVTRNEDFELSNSQINKEKSANSLAWAKHTGVDIDAKLMVGYRFCPQFVIAGGIGGNMSTNSQIETFSLPLFLHLRSDFINAKVTPYAELNIGYAIMFNAAIAGEEQAGVSYEFDFGNGNTKGTNIVDYDIIKNGLFGEFTLGVSFPAGLSRMNIGVGCNLSECFRGLIMGSHNGYVRYGYNEDIIPRAKYEWNDKTKQYVLSDYYTYGIFSTGNRTEPFMRRFHSGIHFKIGFSF